MESLEKRVQAGADRKIADSSKDHIPGWGIDADPDNDPTYPIKHRNGADYQRFNYERVTQQHVDMEILKSTERPEITRVFGTSSPPSGLSGMMRRHAYKYSENQTIHWMTLLMADRVNVIEGIIEDLAKGIVPNIFYEKGWKSEWKYNRTSLIKRIAVHVIIVGGVIALLNRKKFSKRSFNNVH